MNDRIDRLMAEIKTHSIPLDCWNDIIAAQDAYITFLGRYIQGSAVYLEIHGMGCPAETVREGARHRETISNAKERLKEQLQK